MEATERELAMMEIPLEIVETSLVNANLLVPGAVEVFAFVGPKDWI